MGVIFRARQRHSRLIVAVNACWVITRIPAQRWRASAAKRKPLQTSIIPTSCRSHEVSNNEDGLPFFSGKFASGDSVQKQAPRCATTRRCDALVAGNIRTFLQT